jgi:hypothetical protein
MTAHELAKHLLRGPDVDVVVSVDISTCEDDIDARVFGTVEDYQVCPGPVTSEMEFIVLATEAGRA